MSDRPASSDQAEDDAFDFAAYELDGLGDDIRSVLDFAGAMSAVGRWILGVPVVAAIVSWVIFTGRIESRLLLTMFVVAAAVASVPIGASIGSWRLARRRLDTVTEATGRVVDVISTMHGDVMRVRAGTAQTSVQTVAVDLLEQAVFPTVFATVSSTAEGMLGPLGFVAERVSRAPLKLVERSVVSAIGSLPDRQIGELVDGASSALQIDDAVAKLTDDYLGVRGNLTAVVRRVSRTSLSIALALGVLALVPLASWWAIGLLAT